MKLLLDSNAYSHLKRGHRRVADLVLGAEEILLPAFVVGELLYGFRKGARFERNIRDMYAFLDHPYRHFCPIQPRNGRPLRENCHIVANEGPPHSVQRYLGRSACHGDRCRPRFV